MIRRSFWKALLVLWPIVIASPAARADFMYTFDQSNYVVNTGDSLDVKVFLQETTASGGTSILATDGLTGGGVRVTLGSVLPSSPAFLGSAADIIANPAFNDPSGPIVSFATNDYGLSEITDLTNPSTVVLGTSFATDTYRVLLGTFRFTAGSVPGQVTNLLAGDFSTAFSDNVTGGPNPIALDPLIAGGKASITVRAVPEPSSLGLLLLGTVGALVRRRRMRIQPSNVA